MKVVRYEASNKDNIIEVKTITEEIKHYICDENGNLILLIEDEDEAKQWIDNQ